MDPYIFTAIAPLDAIAVAQKILDRVLKAQERRIRLQKLKGELIERARALALVFRLAREERDAWVNWPARAQ